MENAAGVANPRRVRRAGDVWGGLSALDTDRQLREYAELCGPVVVTRRATLAAADAAIDAHACDLGPDRCAECDRLWSARADAHA